MRPTICQLVHGLPIGGAEVLVDRLIRRLSDRYQFVVACLDEVGDLGRALQHDGFHVEVIGRRPGFDWSSVRRLGRWLAARDAAVVHAHQYTPFAYAAATRVFGRRPRIVFTEHGRFYPDLSSRKRKLFNRVMTSRHDRLIAVGGAVRQALIDNEGLPADRIEVVYNGVNLDPPRLSAAERRALRAELGAGDDDFLVIQVARLDVIKDHATALRAIAAAARQAPQTMLLVVGDGPERPTIERLRSELRLEERVRLLGQRRDVPRLLAAADAFLLTSVSEGIPVTIIEAMAAGLPVVATAVGGVPEVVEHESSGLLAAAGDADGLAAALVRMAGDPDLRAVIAANGRQRATDRFSEEPMSERYARLYTEILAVAPVRHSMRPLHAVTPSTKHP